MSAHADRASLCRPRVTPLTFFGCPRWQSPSPSTIVPDITSCSARTSSASLRVTRIHLSACSVSLPTPFCKQSAQLYFNVLFVLNLYFELVICSLPLSLFYFIFLVSGHFAHCCKSPEQFCEETNEEETEVVCDLMTVSTQTAIWQ